MNGNLFIRNPYLAIVLAVVITLCGILALLNMPLAQYPTVTPPQISVTVTYPGASAETILNSVIIPLEQQINGAPDMIYIDSTSTNSGQGVITVTFAVGTDPATARQNVQDRVNWAKSQLPEAVQREGVIVREQSGNILLGVSLYSPDNSYDTLFMSNYAAINLQNDLARIPGVARVQLFGGSEYAMRIWLKPDKCDALNLPVSAVIDALQQQNIQVTSGYVGSAPAPATQEFALNVTTQGRLTSPAEFADIIVRSAPDGAQIKLSDIAVIENGAESYATNCTINNMPAVMLVIFQLNDANGIAISEHCRKIIAEKQPDFPPGLYAGFQYDSTNFVRAGIKDVIKTLILAVILVAVVTLAFLQDWRMALIPVLAIPVSIIGTFAVLFLLNFSINMITLFALTLAIGIVVDDAIIVIENVSRLMDTEQLSPKNAAEKSMKEITGAIMATTMVLLAMFLPICFFPGITGELYREFGITLSVAVAISAFNALSLSPALSSLLLREHQPGVQPGFFLYRWFNKGFNYVAEGGHSLLKWGLKVPLIFIFIYLFLCAGAFYWYTTRPGGFLPTEDQGYFFATLQLPSGAALSQTNQLTEQLSAALKHLPGVADIVAIPGYNVLNSAADEKCAFIIVIMQPESERRGIKLANVLQQAQMTSFAVVPTAFGMFFEPPSIPGIGMAGGFNFVLESRNGDSPTVLNHSLQDFMAAAMQKPQLANLFTTFNADTPEWYLNIDRAKALRNGVELSTLNAVLENTLGYTFINQFNRFGQVYKVELQANAPQRCNADDILALHVINQQGNMVPLAAIGSIEQQWSSAFLSRHNLKLSAAIQGMPGNGYSSEQAMQTLENLADSTLPDNMSYEWTDMSYQEASAGNYTVWILLLAVSFIFLFLSALYQSWLLPWSVLPVIPLALLGALSFTTLAQLENNIYTQIGLVLLFGMACKTAILVADFAKQHHDAGKTPFDAAQHAAKLRFRAVMMTSTAFICGTLPLMLANGSGAADQRSIGIPVVGGMFGVILGGLLVSPIFFAVLMNSLLKHRKKLSLWWLFFLLSLTFFSGCYTPPPNATLITAKTLSEAQQNTAVKHLPANLTSLSREAAVDLALSNNPNYLSAMTSINAAKMRYYQALGAYSPTASAGVSLGQELFSGNGNSAFAEDDNSGYVITGIQGNWILFNGLLREFEVLAAKENIKLQESLCKNARRLLAQAVLVAYDDIITTQAQVGIAQANLNFQRQQLQQTERKVALGEAGPAEQLNFQAQIIQSEIELLKMQNQSNMAKLSLALLLGLTEDELPPQLTFDPLPAAVQHLPALEFFLNESIANRSDLQAVRDGLQLQKYRHYQTYSLFSPTIAANANYTYSSGITENASTGGNNGNFFLAGNSFTYGGMAYWNIFTGFQRYNLWRETKYQLDKSWLLSAGYFLKTMNEIHNAYLDTVHYRQVVELTIKLRTTREQERNLTAAEYNVGDTALINLNQAQDNFVRSEYELIAAQASLNKALTKLYYAAELPLPKP